MPEVLSGSLSVKHLGSEWVEVNASALSMHDHFRSEVKSGHQVSMKVRKAGQRIRSADFHGHFYVMSVVRHLAKSCKTF